MINDYNRTPYYEKFIPGFDGKYSIATDGTVINNCFRDIPGNRKELKQSPHAKYGSVVVHLKRPDGERRVYTILHLMALTFVGPQPQPKGRHKYVARPKNGYKTDFRPENIQWQTTIELQKHANLYHRKCVVHVDRHGEPIEYFYSSKEAGEKFFLTNKTIQARCRGVMKFPMDDGTDFYYENDDNSRVRCMKRLGVQINSRGRKKNNEQ